MNPKHFHTPPSSRALCPVCKKAVYSPAGIHPQCAMLQSDAAHASSKKRSLIVHPDPTPEGAAGPPADL